MGFGARGPRTVFAGVLAQVVTPIDDRPASNTSPGDNPASPTVDRAYDLVVFDLDGTLIQGTIFIWQTLHETFRTDAARRRRAKEDFFSGRITYKDWFDHDLVLLREVHASRDRMIESMAAIRPTPGAFETLRALREAGCRLAILSGSLDLVLDRFFPNEPFDEVLINVLHFDPEGLIAGGVHTPYDVDEKGAGLREIARRLAIPLERTVFVGDNFNDISAARVAGLAIAFNPRSPELESISHQVVREQDLRAILPLILN